MRKMVRTVLVAMVSVFVLICCSRVFETPPPVPKEDLDGFRGVGWGTDNKETAGLIYHETREDSNLDHIKYVLYKRKKEKMELGLVILDEINYWFWQGKLAKVTMEASGGEPVFNFLRDVCFEKFGQGRYRGKTGSDKTRPQYTYQWVGKNIHIDLSYYSWGDTIIWLNSRKVITEQYDYLRNKIKEGAEKGF